MTAPTVGEVEINKTNDSNTSCNLIATAVEKRLKRERTRHRRFVDPKFKSDQKIHDDYLLLDTQKRNIMCDRNQFISSSTSKEFSASVNKNQIKSGEINFDNKRDKKIELKNNDTTNSSTTVAYETNKNLLESKTKEYQEADKMAMNYFHSFVQEMKQYTTRITSSTNENNGISRKTTSLPHTYWTEKYLVQRLNKLPDTIKTKTIKKKTINIIEKFQALCSENKYNIDEDDLDDQRGSDLFSQGTSHIHDKNNCPKSSLTTEPKRLSWNCLICGKENLLLETHKCRVCGRIRGYTGKKKSNEPCSDHVLQTKVLGLSKDVIQEKTKLESNVNLKESSILPCNNETDQKKEGKTRNSRQKNQKVRDIYLKTKVDYEIGSREELSNDIHNVLASIRNTIEESETNDK